MFKTENSNFNINVRRSSKPVASHNNFSMTMGLIVPGDVESNQIMNVHSIEGESKVNLFPQLVKFAAKQ